MAQPKRIHRQPSFAVSAALRPLVCRPGCSRRSRHSLRPLPAPFGSWTRNKKHKDRRRTMSSTALQELDEDLRHLLCWNLACSTSTSTVSQSEDVGFIQKDVPSHSGGKETRRRGNCLIRLELDQFFEQNLLKTLVITSASDQCLFCLTWSSAHCCLRSTTQIFSLMITRLRHVIQPPSHSKGHELGRAKLSSFASQRLFMTGSGTSESFFKRLFCFSFDRSDSSRFSPRHVGCPRLAGKASALSTDGLHQLSRFSRGTDRPPRFLLHLWLS